MPLDKQIAGVLQQFRDIPEPDFSQVDAAQYRQFSDNLLPAIPGDPMSEVRDLRVAGADGELDARLYRPSEEPDLPLLVFFHGGGFVMGNLDTHDNLCRSLARQTEAVVVSVAYRLAPESKFPGCASRLLCGHLLAGRTRGRTGRRWQPAGCGRGQRRGQSGAGGQSVGGTAAGAEDQLSVPVLPGHRCGLRQSVLRRLRRGLFASAAMMRWFWQQYLQDAGQADDPWPRRCAPRPGGIAADDPDHCRVRPVAR